MLRNFTWALAIGLCAGSLAGDDAPADPPAKGPRAAVRPLPRESPEPTPLLAPDAEEAVPPTIRRLNGQLGLEGKYLAVTLKSDPDYGVYLHEVQMRSLGRDSFLVGVGIDTGFDEWTSKRRIWIAVDDISQIIEFDKLDDLKKLIGPEDRDPDA